MIVWAREQCRISPPRFLAECCKRQLNQDSFVLLYFRLSTFSDCIEFVYLYFHVLFCLSVSIKWLAVKTASEMTYTVSSGALNSTPTNQPTTTRTRPDHTHGPLGSPTSSRTLSGRRLVRSISTCTDSGSGLVGSQTKSVGSCSGI